MGQFHLFLVIFLTFVNAKEHSYLFRAVTFVDSQLVNDSTIVPHKDNHDMGKVDLQSSFSSLFDWSTKPKSNLNKGVVDPQLLRDMQETCSRQDFFYSANPAHRTITMEMLKMLLEPKDAEEAIDMAASLREKREINPNAWLRAVTAASLHREDWRGFMKPPLVEVWPSAFIPDEAIETLRKQALPEGVCVRVDESLAADNGIEGLLWYWREDVMFNSFHWYWHLSYPFTGTQVYRDRRGELFAWVHHTLLARYNAERLSNGLRPVKPLALTRGTVLNVPYNPHLRDPVSRRNWSPRPPGVVISDVMSTALRGPHPLQNVPPVVSIDNGTIQLQRILQSIAGGALISASGDIVPLQHSQGIDILGNAVEASIYSINPAYYGDFGIHNAGHVLISLVLDPLQRLNLPPGVMGDLATAARDPIFYPYHEFIDDIFDAHKRTLPPYQLDTGDWPLVFPGVEILHIAVQTPYLPTNHLQTFWNERVFDISRGLDFNASAGPLLICAKHLDHLDFQYEFVVQSQHSVSAQFRILLAPRFDARGHIYNLERQRRRFFTLDQFVLDLNPGLNKVVRKSIDSVLTIDFQQSYLELQNPQDFQTPDCGCGFPHHLLLPKGHPEGMQFDLFVMATDANLDTVPISGKPQQCQPAPILCGIPGELYPDARPMGYPFDRSIYTHPNINPLDPGFNKVPGYVILEDWISHVPNMAATKVVITHNG